MPLPVTVFAGGALVMLFLAPGEAHEQFRAAFGPVQVQRHQRVALTLNGADQAVQLLAVQEQFARARRKSAGVAGPTR